MFFLSFFARTLTLVLVKCLYFKSQEVAASGYYGIENILPYVMFFNQPFLVTGCFLSEATGALDSQNSLFQAIITCKN